MNFLPKSIRWCGIVLLAACAEEPPPISTEEFMDQPRLLEATMVRCAQNRAESRYLPECINARDAVNRLEAAEERSRREDLEAQSQRKRQALRRTQAAAAEARRRAIENQRRREEEEYQGIFGQVPEERAPSVVSDQPAPAVGNEPAVVVPQTTDPDLEQSNEPAEVPENQEPESDLSAIREDLKRRQETPQ